MIEEAVFIERLFTKSNAATTPIISDSIDPQTESIFKIFEIFWGRVVDDSKKQEGYNLLIQLYKVATNNRISNGFATIENFLKNDPEWSPFLYLPAFSIWIQKMIDDNINETFKEFNKVSLMSTFIYKKIVLAINFTIALEIKNKVENMMIEMKDNNQELENSIKKEWSSLFEKYKSTFTVLIDVNLGLVNWTQMGTLIDNFTRSIDMLNKSYVADAPKPIRDSLCNIFVLISMYYIKFPRNSNNQIKWGNELELTNSEFINWLKKFNDPTFTIYTTINIKDEILWKVAAPLNGSNLFFYNQQADCFEKPWNNLAFSLEEETISSLVINLIQNISPDIVDLAIKYSKDDHNSHTK